VLWISRRVTEVSPLFGRLISGALFRPSLRYLSMRMLTKAFVFSMILAPMFLPACRSKLPARNRLDEKQFPPIVLWAWERPEDLQFIDTNRFGVAFLAQTLTLKAEDVVLTPRHQPLKISPTTQLIAVTRIESQKITGQRPALSATQRERLLKLIVPPRESTPLSGVWPFTSSTCSYIAAVMLLTKMPRFPMPPCRIRR